MMVFLSRILAKIICSTIKGRQDRIYNIFRQQYDISPTFIFNGDNINLTGNGKIIIGEGSYIGQRSSIEAYDGAIVKIGRNCSISHNVRIYTYNLDPISVIKEQKSQQNSKSGDVIIGDNCWIGANVFIKENVTIGNNCVISANSLVTRNIPSNSIAMGVPAKVVKQYDTEQCCFIEVK